MNKSILSNSNNNSIIIKNATGAFIIKGLSLILSLFTMPVYMEYFNDNIILGLWFTILSVLHWILTFDLGIGNGLRNHLTIAFVEGNNKKVKELLSSAYASIGLICLIISVVFIISANFINWNVVFSISENVVSAKTLKYSVIIVFIGILVQFFLKIITTVFYSMQKSYYNNVLLFVTSVITLVSVYCAPSRGSEQNLLTMAIISSACIALPMLIVTSYIFTFGSLRKTAPSIFFVTKDSISKILKLGISFFFIQSVYMVLMNTNPFLINILSGNQFVVDNQIYTSVFSLVSTLFSLALTPIWSVVTKAFAEKNFLWLNKLYSRLLSLAIAASALQLILIPLVQFIIDVWLGDKSIDVDWRFSLSFACMTAITIFTSVFSSISNGIGKLKIQGLCYSIAAIVKIPLSLILVSYLGSWIGVIWANILSLLPYIILQPIYINRYFYSLKNN